MFTTDHGWIGFSIIEMLPLESERLNSVGVKVSAQL